MAALEEFYNIDALSLQPLHSALINHSLCPFKLSFTLLLRSPVRRRNHAHGCGGHIDKLQQLFAHFAFLRDTTCGQMRQKRHTHAVSNSSIAQDQRERTVKPLEPKQHCRGVQSVQLEKRQRGVEVVAFDEKHHPQHYNGKRFQFPAV